MANMDSMLQVELLDELGQVVCIGRVARTRTIGATIAGRRSRRRRVEAVRSSILGPWSPVWALHVDPRGTARIQR
jgi:hypothetical protein